MHINIALLLRPLLILEGISMEIPNSAKKKQELL